jgi:hypothetical protein
MLIILIENKGEDSEADYHYHYWGVGDFFYIENRDEDSQAE